MRKILIPVFFALTLSLLVVSIAFAQAEELTLNFSKDFGYSSGSGEIQGTFSMRVGGPDDLARVEFYIDEALIGEDAEPPFRLQFSTDNFPVGEHSMYAIGYTTSGQELHSPVRHANFITAQEGWQAAGKIIIPLIAVIVGAVLLSAVVPMLTGRGQHEKLPLGSERSYGISGGAICPKCQRPFSIHFFGMNMVVGKLDRCPYCGKWSVVRIASAQELRAAEEAEVEASRGQMPDAAPEEKFKKDLDDSKYQGL